MNIYIDESGSFIIPTIKRPKVSCVAALVLPSSKRDEILDGFVKIRSRWSLGADEIKGSKLNESQIAEAINFLGGYDVLVDIYAIDTGTHTEQQVADYKKVQAFNVTKNLTPNHYPSLIQELHQLRRSLENLSNQLFAQFIPTILLIERIIGIATLYYSQRLPEELGAFHWIVDAKDTNVTNYEKLWTTLILPMIVTKSPNFGTFDEGDYSYFKKFYTTVDEAPDNIKEYVDDSTAPFEGIDFKKIMQESFVFGDSKQDAGLQLVDIVASTLTRAMNQTLGKQGWQNLGALMVRRKGQPVQMIHLNLAGEKVIRERNYYGHVLKELDGKAKSMLLPRNIKIT